MPPVLHALSTSLVYLCGHYITCVQMFMIFLNHGYISDDVGIIKVVLSLLYFFFILFTLVPYYVQFVFNNYLYEKTYISAFLYGSVLFYTFIQKTVWLASLLIMWNMQSFAFILSTVYLLFIYLFF